MHPKASLVACCFAVASTVARGDVTFVERDASASPYVLDSERDGARVIEYRVSTQLSGQRTQYVNSPLPLPERCAASRSCFVVAVETLIDHRDLVHHLDILQPKSAKTCESGRGSRRFSGVARPARPLMWHALPDASWDPQAPCVVIQTHFHNPAGQTPVDRTGVRLHVASRPRPLVQRSITIDLRPLSIPAKQERYFLTATSHLRVDPATRVDKVYVHAHLLAREMYTPESHSRFEIAGDIFFHPGRDLSRDPRTTQVRVAMARRKKTRLIYRGGLVVHASLFAGAANSPSSRGLFAADVRLRQQLPELDDEVRDGHRDRDV